MPIRFDPDDLQDLLPPAGFYPSRISCARLRHSACGHRMVQVVHTLDCLPPAFHHLADYFLLEGASPSGLACARRRLVALYRACGFDPKPGDDISPADLIDCRLEVRLEHEHWGGRPRLRIAAHRPIALAAAPDRADLPF